ncbi:MAG: hypothetical protein PHF79_01010 [Candidatus Pacebacteria bacterium]|nr:hypothetical protein [Candidatus Paceibacterota bacterium]
MLSVSNFLSRYQTFKDSTLDREKIAQTLSIFMKVSFTKKEIILKDNVLFIKTHPAIKNEIFLKKTSILSYLKEKNPEVSVSDIR